MGLFQMREIEKRLEAGEPESELAALRARVAELEADAARLNWLDWWLTKSQLPDLPWNNITFPHGVPIRDTLDRMRRDVPSAGVEHG